MKFDIITLFPEMFSAIKEEGVIARAIKKSLISIHTWQLRDFSSNKYKNVDEKYFNETKHDIVSFVRSISENLGDESRWIHHGITSNDVKDTALSLQLVESIDHIISGIEDLMSSLKEKAIDEIDTPIMGRSHGMHAEPMSFGSKLGIFWDELSRHTERFKQTKERSAICMISGPVGSFATVSPELEKTRYS